MLTSKKEIELKEKENMISILKLSLSKEKADRN